MRLWHPLLLTLLLICGVCRAAKVSVHPRNRQCVSQVFSELLAVSLGGFIDYVATSANTSGWTCVSYAACGSPTEPPAHTRTEVQTSTLPSLCRQDWWRRDSRCSCRSRCASLTLQAAAHLATAGRQAPAAQPVSWMRSSRTRQAQRSCSSGRCPAMRTSQRLPPASAATLSGEWRRLCWRHAWPPMRLLQMSATPPSAAVVSFLVI